MIAKPLETLVDGAFAQMFSRTPSDDEQLAEREETEALARQGTASFELANPTRRLRVNLVKNTKGFNHDSTFEIEAQISEEQLYAYMDHLDAMACRLIVKGIARREAIDRGESIAAEQVAAHVVTPPASAETIDELPF